MTTLFKLALALLVGSAAAVLLFRPEVEKPRRLEALDGSGSVQMGFVVERAHRAG